MNSSHNTTEEHNGLHVALQFPQQEYLWAKLLWSCLVGIVLLWTCWSSYSAWSAQAPWLGFVLCGGLSLFALWGAWLWQKRQFLNLNDANEQTTTPLIIGCFEQQWYLIEPQPQRNPKAKKTWINVSSSTTVWSWFIRLDYHYADATIAKKHYVLILKSSVGEKTFRQLSRLLHHLANANSTER